jgi:hypothetical protein
MKNTLDYVLEIIRDFHNQYKKYPTGSKIRFEIYLGEDGTEKSHEDDDNGEAIDAFNLRMKALTQLHEEGLILDYKIDQRYDFVYEYKVAECLVDRSKLLEHIAGSEGKAISEEKEEDYDGISFPYQYTDVELFILKKILLEHKQRDDAGFLAKEFSFDNNSLTEICRTINRLIQDKVLILSANTMPPALFDDESVEGIQDEQGFINWQLAEKLDKNPKQMDAKNGTVIFDTEVIDEVKLKGRIDIGIEEFMSDKIFDENGFLARPSEGDLGYKKQRDAVLNELAKNQEEETSIQLNRFPNPKIDVLKTLLCLEKENLLRIKELKSNDLFENGIKSLGRWSSKDNPTAVIFILKTQASKQEPLLVKIVNDIGIRNWEEKVVIPKPKNKKLQIRNFPKDLRWEEITMTFLNDHEVIVEAKKETHQTTYQAMGFQDEKRKLPNKQWTLLMLLSTQGGSISWENANKLNLRQINAIKKQKQSLSEALKAYFQIESDPFMDYKEEGAYKIKINLIPENKSELPLKENDKNSDIEKFRQEQSPSKYEE